MKKIFTVATCIVLWMFWLNPAAAIAQDVEYELEEVFPGITVSQILGLEAPINGSSLVYLLSQQGIIYQVDTDEDEPEAVQWLDISDRLVSGGERGLLGLAFHPDYEENGRFYVNYTASGPNRTVISRFTANGDGTADPDSEEVLLEFDQPFGNHNGGQISFGPDGYLYIASGDGGSGGDPQNHGQNPQTLLGAMLRIDVDQTDTGLEYAIPEDNPFLGSDEGADEIFAWGLRNPWRFSFDRETGDLWTGDVGQNAWEVIHIIENGLNYGWNILEGSHCYPPGSSCDPSGLELPIYEYDHSQGDRSITGGYVYRGDLNPSLQGKYIYGDYISGRIWALDYDMDDGEVISNVELINAPFNISSFGEDASGELYILAYNTGRVYRFVPEEDEDPGPEPPEAPEIVEPEEDDRVELDHMISWTEVEDADTYQLQVATEEDPDFENPVIDEILEETEVMINLDAGFYYTRVRAENEGGQSDYSEAVFYEVLFPASVDPDDELPRTFTLNYAYPNPFNPVTQVNFTLPESGRVHIEVYNAVGQRVATLVNDAFPAGSHTATFDAGGLSSGIYLVRGVMGDQTDVLKITFVK